MYIIQGEREKEKERDTLANSKAEYTNKIDVDSWAIHLNWCISGTISMHSLMYIYWHGVMILAMLSHIFHYRIKTSATIVFLLTFPQILQLNKKLIGLCRPRTNTNTHIHSDIAHCTYSYELAATSQWHRNIFLLQWNGNHLHLRSFRSFCRCIFVRSVFNRNENYLFYSGICVCECLYVTNVSSVRKMQNKHFVIWFQ